MTTLYKDALHILEKRGILFVEKFNPKLLCSYAAHVANLENMGDPDNNIPPKKFYLEQDRIPDLRMHILLIAPPGFAKSTSIKQLMHKDYGLLYTDDIQMRFEGYSTEAGMVGSIDKAGNTVTRIEGLFEEYKRGIVGFEEFYAVTQAMNQSHSGHLEPAMNQALLDGNVRKRLRGGVIEYDTSLTMWAATQVTRFEVGGGLIRRMLPEIWTPTDKEGDALKNAVKNGVNLSLDPQILIDYRQRIKNFNADMKIIRQVSYTDDVFDFIKSDVPHYRIPTIMRFALGYNLLNNPIERNFVVDLDDELKRLIDVSEKDRKTVIGDPEGEMIISILNDAGGKQDRRKIKEAMIDFSVRFDKSDFLINKLVAEREIMWDRASDIIYTYNEWRRKK